MLFLAYLVPGCVVPLYSKFLANLGFTPGAIGWLCATQTVGSLLGALFSGQVADRWLPANRCLVLCAAVAAGCLVGLSFATEPLAVFVLTFALWLVYGPVFLLGSTICFAHLPEAAKAFGGVRVWGTFGWMVAGWVIGLWLVSVAGAGLADGLRVGAFFAAVLAVYALTVPDTPPQPTTERGPAPLAAYRLLRGRSFTAYCVCVLGVCLTFPVTMQATPLLMSELGASDRLLMPLMTIGQSTELLILPVLALILGRFGFRGTMLLGLGAWAVALCILAVGRPLALVAGSQVLNGVCLTCFIIAGQIYVNGMARPDLRASVQGMLSFVNSLGQTLGHLAVGVVREMNGGALDGAFGLAAVVGVALLPIFYFGFREPVAHADPPSTAELPVAGDRPAVAETALDRAPGVP